MNLNVEYIDMNKNYVYNNLKFIRVIKIIICNEVFVIYLK